MKYKYFVGGGCSFTQTASFPIWVEQLGRLLDVNMTLLYNMAKGGCGNEYIKINTLYKIDELINKGIDPSDIFVAIQWTGYERCDLFVSEEVPTINNLDKDLLVNHIGSGVDENPVPDVGWVYSGAHIARDFKYEKNAHQPRLLQEYLQRWYKYYYTHQGMWVDTLNNILFVQNFCKSHNIDYVFCTGWNLVTDQDNQVKIPTFEQYPGFKFLWDMIDFDRFIFYPSKVPSMVVDKENFFEENLEYGGMWQYMVERDGIDLGDMHPNEHGSKLWAEYVYNTMKDRKLL